MESLNAGVKRLPIAALGENMPNVIIIGIIIAKQNPRSFASKQMEISRPKISFRESKEKKDKFTPSVTSPFQLSLTENQSMMVIHEAEDFYDFFPLLRLPTKPPGDYFTLSDVNHNGSKLRGECVNLLVAVRDIGIVRNIQTKDSRELKCRDVIVFDQTSTGLTFTLWNADTVDRAESWRPRETVLFLADVRLEWNAYRHGMVAAEGPRSIITEDPDLTEATTLKAYALTAPIKATAILAQLATITINNVMTVNQVLERASAGSSDNSGGDDSQFTALLYTPVSDICTNTDCPVGSGAEMPTYDLAFDMRVHEFMDMSMDMKTHLKWKLMLERCAARILVLRSSSNHRLPLVSLLSCSVADPAEVSTCLPIH
ncbi:hypothetical protein C0J52_19238 [Blattella germanica]|nr:hypothetical protein C0J52_19238 [Blattella germanica]